MRCVFRFSLAPLLALALLPAGSLAQSRILPVEAIEASGIMRADAFEAAYPGIPASAESLGVPGYFVVYAHEALRYYFGPVETLAAAREAKRVLLDIRADVIEQREALSNSLVYILRFDLEEGVARWPAVGTPPRTAAINDHQTPEAEAAAPAETSPSFPPPTPERPPEEATVADPRLPSPPPPRPTLWQILRRVFSRD